MTPPHRSRGSNADVRADAGATHPNGRTPLAAEQRLRRRALLDGLLQAALRGDVTLIVAPAGSGKSTLLGGLAADLQSHGYNVHWINLDASHNDPQSFLRHILFDLRELDPERIDTQIGLLKANKESELGARFNALLEILTVRGRKLALCFDDFHHIRNSLILRFLNQFLRHIPTNVSLTLASRTAITLDTGRRRVAGSLAEITQKELNLTPDEIRDYMHVLHSLEISSQDIEALHRVTEGWVAGVQLAALAIRNDPESASRIINGYSSADRNLKEYLFQTVLRGLDDDIRMFLLYTAPLKRMNAALCDAVTGGADAHQMIARVELLNLFLIRLDRQSEWFRYHHLFAEYLLLELQQRHPEKVGDIYLRAARWNQEHGNLTDAIQYLLDAGKFDQAAALINQSATHVAMDFGDHAKILEWMRRLPVEHHDTNPRLLLTHAWSRAFSRDFTTARELCDRAIELIDAPDKHSLDDDERDQLRWYSRVIDIIAIAAAENTLSVIETCDEVIARLPRSEPVLIASVCDTRAYCHLVHHDLPATISSAAEAFQLGMRGGSTYCVLWALLLTGLANLRQANLDAADECVRRARDIFANSDSSGTYLRALTALLPIEIATQQGQFALTQSLLTRDRVMSSIYGPSELLILLYRNEARQIAWNGSPGLARKILQQGQDIGLSTEQQNVYAHLVAEEIDLQLQFESLAAAEDTIRRTNLLNLDLAGLNSDIRTLVAELQQATLARLLLARGKNNDALVILQRLVRAADSQGRKLLAAHLRAMRAVAMWKLGKTQDAIRELDRAISICFEGALVYPLASVGAPLMVVLDEILERRESVTRMDPSQGRKHEFALRARALILGESTLPPAAASSVVTLEGADLSEPGLTDREIEILRLIAVGLSNQELADELLITLSTTKWHLHNVFGKLGVRNRVAAITHARRLQII